MGVPDGDAMEMSVQAALARQYASEQRDFLPFLASMLKSALPNEVQVLEAGLFKKTVRGVVLTQGENRYVLEDSGRGSLQATFTRVVRGIALKTETLSIQEWLACVGQELDKFAVESEQARRALAQSLGLN